MDQMNLHFCFEAQTPGCQTHSGPQLKKPLFVSDTENGFFPVPFATAIASVQAEFSELLVASLSGPNIFQHSNVMACSRGKGVSELLTMYYRTHPPLFIDVVSKF